MHAATDLPPVIVVDLNPIEFECAVCEREFVSSRLRSHGIAMFEGEPVPHDWPGEWGGFACCKGCFDEFERVQANEGERRVWFANKQREARLRRRSEPAFAGDI